jgi:hypothetical protein
MRDDDGNEYTLTDTLDSDLAILNSGDSPTSVNFVAEYGSGDFAGDIRLRRTVTSGGFNECLELISDRGVQPRRRPCNDTEPLQASYDCAFDLMTNLTCSDLVVLHILRISTLCGSVGFQNAFRWVGASLTRCMLVHTARARTRMNGRCRVIKLHGQSLPACCTFYFPPICTMFHLPQTPAFAALRFDM